MVMVGRVLVCQLDLRDLRGYVIRCAVILACLEKIRCLLVSDGPSRTCGSLRPEHWNWELFILYGLEM
jgi:hypothetical protein